MFANFKKIVKNNDGTTGKLPQPFVDYLSQSLPEGTTYSQVEDGVCVITPNAGIPMKVSGLTPNLNEQQKSVLGEKYSLNELLKYCNNAQSPIELVPIQEGKILVNDEDVDMDKLIINPKNDNSGLYLKQFLNPEKFPEETKATLSIGDISKDLYVKRIANESIYVMAFETRDDDFFKIKFFLDEKNITSKFTVSIKSDNVKMVEEVIIGMRLYNAFLNGSVLWDGKQVSPIVDESKNYFAEDTIEYWEKIREIEKRLDLKFVPDTNDVTFQTAWLVERIYQSLINKQPVIAPYNINSINGKGESYKAMKDYIGKRMMIKVESSEDFELYGVKFTLHNVSCIFNCVINDIEKKDKEFKYILSDDSEGEKRYVSVLYFPTVEDAVKFDVENNIPLFENAKRAKDYI